jgi:hypothetical protein
MTDEYLKGITERIPSVSPSEEAREYVDLLTSVLGMPGNNLTVSRELLSAVKGHISRTSEKASEVERLQETIEFARNYKGIEGRACPLCVYEDGKPKEARMLAAALHWLRNHYEAGTQDDGEMRDKVIECIDRVLSHREVTVAELGHFREMYMYPEAALSRIRKEGG